uniref:HDC12224 n=1 Tax=Drosophila melanogaster TaxID=7227 RepID=Q6IKK0_DROME|nr:TPA_inf: HDC12224 [Drosophila melanogaster]
MEEKADIIKTKILNGTYSVAIQRKGKSVIWSILCDILKENGTVLDGWLYCSKCRKVLKFVPNHISNLSRHKCCLTLRRPTELKIVSESDKEEAIEVCTQWVVQDCQSFSAVTGAGFKNLVQFFLKIGAVYGEHVDVDDLLPDPTTLSLKAHSEAEEKGTLVSAAIKEAVDSDSGGTMTATADLIKKKIMNGAYTVANQRKGKSVIWSILCDIFKEDETVLDGWLFCSKCRKVLKFIQNHTSNLSRHKCCLQLRRPTELKIVSEIDREEAIEKCTQWVVQDRQSFSAVTGAGFKNLVQFFLKIGAVYGDQVDVDDLLPDPTTC